MNGILNESIPLRPWYKEPWPWMLMSIPALTVVAGFITYGLAVSSPDGIVADDYYKQGMAVNQVIDRDIAARELGLQANIMRNGREIRVFLTGQGLATLPDQLLLRLTHPTLSGMDQNIMLMKDDQGFYSGRLEADVGGRRHVFLEDQASTWRLTGNWQLSGEALLQLLPLQ